MSAAMLDIDLSGLELLVVEDDETSSLLISRVLSKYGARVETATNGNEGLQKYQVQQFPIIITDINMPDMNGLEMVSRIKALDQDTQIIATSANRDTECLVTAIGLGFSDYFLKPIEIEKLLLAIKRCSDVIAVKQQLNDEREKFRTVVECLGEGISIKALDFRILYQNRAMTEMFGDQTGSTCYESLGLEEPCVDCPTVQTLIDGQNHSACRTYQSDGALVHFESTASQIRDSRGVATGTVEITRDISERIKYEKNIREMAFHDPLTGLANRRLFEDRLEQAIVKSRRYGRKFGLLYLDLDHFKEINDTLGHEAGDQVLLEAAERIRSCCKRDLDTISRHGGDEFCIIFTDCRDRGQLIDIAQQLLLQFSLPFQITGALAEVTVSIGISMFPDDGSDVEKLEIASDRAMYAAKRAGRNTYMLSQPEPG
jgi:diguanylate cyclase (GGDEF)-like protein